VKLRNDPRVGHDPRIGGQQPGHVLPERDPRGAEGARQQRGREIRAAPAQRGHFTLGRGSDEPRDDGDDAACEQRRQGPLHAPVGPRKVRRRLPEGAIGVDEVEGVHVLCLDPGGIERRRDQPGAQPLPARGEVVGGPRRELAQEAKPLGQGFELLEHVADVGQQVRPAPARRQQRPRHLRVTRTEAGNQRRDGARLAGSGLLRHAKERVGGPRHGRDDHDGGLLAVTADDVDGMADGGGIGQRCTAELVHVRCAAGPRHRSLRISSAGPNVHHRETMTLRAC
jgi:hypothetical protein